MKKFATMIALVALFVLMALSASALQITSATIGNDNQDRIKNVSQTITVTNNDTTSVAVTFASTADAKYNVRFEPASATFAAGEVKSVKVITDIPLDFHAVETSSSASDFLEEKALLVGKLQGKIGSTVAAESDLKIQAANQLEIKKARLECDTKAESLDDGDKVENLKPDMQCSLEVEVENNFPQDDDEDASGNDMKIGDIEFDNVEVKIEIDDSDFDLDEEEDLDGLGADDEDSVSVDFDIDEDVDDGTFTMDIFVEGRDENGATHGEHWEIRLEVERLSHDIQIRAPAISPDRMSACDASTVRVTSRVANFGKRDEDEVAVELSVPELKVSKRIDQIELDEDDSTSVNFVFDVPEKTKAGVYRATLNTFFDNTAPSNSQALEFTVEKCEEEQDTVVVTTPDTATQTGQTGTTTQTGTQPTTPTGATGAVAVPRARVTSSSGFTDSPAYLWLLGGMAVLLLIIIIALVVVAFRKPRQEML
jgi:hypothetical protein